MFVFSVLRVRESSPSSFLKSTSRFAVVFPTLRSSSILSLSVLRLASSSPTVLASFSMLVKVARSLGSNLAREGFSTWMTAPPFLRLSLSPSGPATASTSAPATEVSSAAPSLVRVTTPPLNLNLTEEGRLARNSACRPSSMALSGSLSELAGLRPSPSLILSFCANFSRSGPTGASGKRVRMSATSSATEDRLISGVIIW